MMITRYCLILTLLFVVSLQANSQTLKPTLENAVWEVFANRTWIQALSQTGENLWVGTGGGLEQREAKTGELLRFFTHFDGLPGNNIQAIASGTQDDVWIGTTQGLAYLETAGQWIYFDQENSPLPNNDIRALWVDERGGVWIGTFLGGLAYYHRAKDHWQTFTTLNAALPSDQITALATDNEGGLWIGTLAGLAHRNQRGGWTLNMDMAVQNKQVASLSPDGQGGVWVGTTTQLLHRSVTGQWSLFYPPDAALQLNGALTLQPDQQGGLWVGGGNLFSFSGDEGDGLIYLNANGDWTSFNTNNSSLPHNLVTALLPDEQGGLWVGSSNGLSYRSALDQWHLFSQEHSELPSNQVAALSTDAQGGLWVGTRVSQSTRSGLAYLNTDGTWQLFNDHPDLLEKSITALLAEADNGAWLGTTTGLFYLNFQENHWHVQDIATLNEQFSFNQEITALVRDQQGDVWIGTGDNGLFRWQAATQTILLEENLPGNGYIHTLFLEDDNTLWVGTSMGNSQAIAYRDAQNVWQVFDRDNSPLDTFSIVQALSVRDDQVWVGTSEGLLHRDAQGAWQHFDQNNSALPHDDIATLLPDDTGGLWIATQNRFENDVSGGLVYRNAQGEWRIFNTHNSGLPHDAIATLLSDGKSGLWVGTHFGGLVHLTFGQKNKLVETVIQDKPTQDALLHNQRAAILIHPNGQGSGYHQAAAVDFMATYAYHTLHARGYDNDEIYFLSYKPDLDFNGDAQADFNVIDAPVTLAEVRRRDAVPRDLTLADIQAAFEWAKAQGPLDQPLVVIFVDHGLPQTLLLDPLGQEQLNVDLFKTLLDDYQNVTGNALVVILEACYTGTLVDTLAAPDRLIITSTNEKLAYYADLGRVSFLKSYLDQLRQGDSFLTALQTVAETINNYPAPLNQQQPQWHDSAAGTMASALCLNGCWGSLPGVLTLTVKTAGGAVTPGQPVDLTVETHLNAGSVSSVWASVMTPEMASDRNEQGYSRLPTPITYLRRGDDDQWQGRFNNFSATGQYVFTFKARDDKNFVTEAKPITFSVREDTLVLPSLGDRFQGGIAINGMVYQQRATQTLSDTVDITGQIKVPADHVGQLADLIVYAAYRPTASNSQEELFFMLDKAGNVKIWDQTPSKLVAFQENIQLKAEQPVSLYQGQFIATGVLRLFFGYRLADGTRMFNQESIDITIKD